jgi:hypothetical protein
MIANISGAVSSFEETINTLKYANRAKNIKVRLRVDVADLAPCSCEPSTSALEGPSHPHPYPTRHQTPISRNVRASDQRISEYLEVIRGLRGEIEGLKQQLVRSNDSVPTPSTGQSQGQGQDKARAAALLADKQHAAQKYQVSEGGEGSGWR